MTLPSTAERSNRGNGRVLHRSGRLRPTSRIAPSKRPPLDPDQLVLDLDLVALAGTRTRAAPVSSIDALVAAGVPRAGDRFHRSDVALAVMAFHTAFDLPRQGMPSMKVDEEIANLRVSLLVEEVGEFVTATRSGDLVGIADALADVVYVAYGAAVTYGIDLDSVVAEVHRANMSKLDAAGLPVLRADGKVLKSDRYRPPNVSGVLHQQLPLPLF
jgi:predicted HAD superfamily Cof-like phosphohydrolase